MFRKLILLALIICCLGCDKKQQDRVGCPTGACTMIFAMIGVHFTDKNGAPVAVQNLTAINQRTKLSVLPASQQGINDPGYYVITDDGRRERFSDDGDEVIISATYPATGQTKTATFKISGGCNCHVDRISGMQTIAFD